MKITASKLRADYASQLVAIDPGQMVTLEATGGTAEISFDGSTELTALLPEDEPVTLLMPHGVSLFVRKIDGKPSVQVTDVTGMDKKGFPVLIEPNRSTAFKKLAPNGATNG